MKTAIGIINLHDNPQLGKLTENRPLGAVTFLGRYGLIDFALSNFSNSDINKFEILAESHLDSIRSHIQNGNVWVRNTKTGFIRVCINEKGLMKSTQNTDIANIFENVPMDAFNEQYVIVAAPYYLMSIDYREVLKSHSDSNAGITVVYHHTDDAMSYKGSNRVLIDPSDSSIHKFLKVDGTEPEADVSLESYVFDMDVFIGLLRFSKEISNTSSTIKKMVELYANNKMTKVNGYRFDGYVVPVLSLNQYVKESFKLLENKNRKQLFQPEWPIYTTTHNTPPVLYGPNADVSNSFISNGSIIKGKVKNSIIARDVVVEEGANIENCILFSRDQIGQNVSLKYLVADKAVSIKEVKNLVGDEEDYLLIAKGAKI